MPLHVQTDKTEEVTCFVISFHVISYVADGGTGTGLTEEQHTQGR